MSNLALRSITAVFFVIIMVATIMWSPISFALFFLFVNNVGLHEFMAMQDKAGKRASKKLAFISGNIVFLVSMLVFLNVLDAEIIPLAGIAVFGIFIAELFRDKVRPFSNIAHTLTSVMYVSVPFSLFFFVSKFPLNEYNPYFVMSLVIMVWANDTFAYLVGRKLGKRKLFERISPKKTIEGALGGLAGTISAAVILSRFNPDTTVWFWVGLAVVVAVFFSIGDLVESLLKRSVDIKDSGNIMPGHGGLLDRFDGYLIGLPAVYVYLTLIPYFS
ncbi:MAG: phosphatidate cytidylyltransferase [Sphingobacteriales bacterium]|jgi:phosphatidate cytidylyltransferase